MHLKDNGKKKLADKLNWINSYNLRNYQVLPFYTKDNLGYLKIIEAMKRMFMNDHQT